MLLECNIQKDLNFGLFVGKTKKEKSCLALTIIYNSQRDNNGTTYMYFSKSQTAEMDNGMGLGLHLKSAIWS